MLEKKTVCKTHGANVSNETHHSFSFGPFHLLFGLALAFSLATIVAFLIVFNFNAALKSLFRNFEFN